MSRKASIILTSVVGVVAGLWLWSGLIPKDAISIGGSTSVDPLMQLLTNEYKDAEGKEADSFVYSSSGSSGGVNNVISGTYKMGFISKKMDSNVNYVKNVTGFTFNGDEKDWKARGNSIQEYLENQRNASGDLNYVHVADDAIIIAYNPPKWFKDYKDGLLVKNFKLKEFTNGNPDPKDKELMRIIYGINGKWTDVANFILENYGNGEKLEGVNPTEKENKITAFSRESGSGTRTSFDKTFGLISDSEKGIEFKPGASVYNSNGMVYKNMTPGSIGYVSLNYLKQIKSNNDLQIVPIGDKDESNPRKWDLTNTESLTKVVDNYGLKRPYIGLIKKNLDDDYIKKISNFLGWLSQGSQDKNVAEEYKNAYLVPKFDINVSTGLIDNSGTKEETKQFNSLDETINSIKVTITMGYEYKK